MLTLQIYDWQPIPYTYKELVDQKTDEGVEINMPDELKKKVLNIAMFNGELNKSRQAIVRDPLEHKRANLNSH